MTVRDRLIGLAEFGDERRRHRAIAALATCFALLVASPVIWMVVRALGAPPDAFALLVSPGTLQVLVNSVVVIAAVSAFSVLIGVPLAVLTVQTDLPFGRFWTVTAALPLVIPEYIGAFAFASAFGPHGAFADALVPLGVTSIPTIYGLQGTVIVFTLFTYPYVFLTTRAGLLSVDETLVEAARTLDRSSIGALREIVLPQVLPAISAGVLLTALDSLADFGTPAIMHYDTFMRQIYVQYNNYAQPGYTALLSMELLVVVAVVLVLESRVSGDANAGFSGGGSGRPGSVRLGRWRWPATLFPAAVAVLAIGVPLAILVKWHYRTGTTYAGFAFHLSDVLHSVEVSALAAVAALVASLPVAYYAARSDSPLSTVVDRVSYVGYAVPGLVLGISLVYFGTAFVPALYQTLPMLVFAYVVRFLPQAVGSVRSSFLQVDDTLTEAARTLEHSPLAAFRRVTIPLVAPGLAAGAALVFLTTMKELQATLVLQPTGFRTLVTYIWKVQEAGYYSEAAIPALVLVGVSALSMLVLLARERYDV
ncbi:ABC transporter permease [Halarchaeum acidiphilum]|uniref:ABC transporter permease n=1 Tax=Halarchaeum acidiphilum TaxID=489138 RepID=UPI00036DC4CE|nr:iron ABC transporter permease [Halarchaeum acidiphilum]